MKELTMQNGDVVDADRADAERICFDCQTPGATEPGPKGEYYHPECLPE